MSDRLRELLRQRALLQEHLAWLDREIAAASGAQAAPGPAPLPVTTPPPGATSVPVGSKPLANESAAGAALAAKVVAKGPAVAPQPVPDAIIEEYRVPPKTLEQDVRRGCFLYFAAALVLLALGVTVLYFAIRSR